MPEETKVKPEETAFKNEHAKAIADLQSENLKLKDMVGRLAKKKAVQKKQAGGSIVGLQGLKGFGRK